MYLYNNIKIKGAWVDDNGTSYPKDWVEGADAQQLIDIDVEEVADILPPAYDPVTQYITEQPDGSYITTNYTQAEIDAQALSKDISTLQGSGKDLALVVVQLVSKLLADGVIVSASFTDDVIQSYLDLKVIADRIEPQP